MPGNRERPLTQTNYQARISYADGNGAIENIYFTSFSGVKDKSQSATYADGKRQKLYKMPASRDIEDISLSAPYKPAEHQVLLSLFKEYSCQEFQVEVQPIKCGAAGVRNEEPLGSPFVLTGCLLLGLEVAESNRESNDVSKITLSMSVDDWSKGDAGALGSTGQAEIFA